MFYLSYSIILPTTWPIIFTNQAVITHFIQVMSVSIVLLLKRQVELFFTSRHSNARFTRPAISLH